MEDESEEEKWAPKKKKAGLLIKEALEDEGRNECIEGGSPK